MNIIQSSIIAPDACIAIIVSRFNKFINSNLLEGSIDTLKRIGKVKDENITIVWVPGSYEISLIADVLSKSKKYDAIIALGTIIRGSTAHFEQITNSVGKNLAEIAKFSEIPVILGVLSTENIEQAIERSGTKLGNKGIESAMTALEMINILREIRHKFQEEKKNIA